MDQPINIPTTVARIRAPYVAVVLVLMVALIAATIPVLPASGEAAQAAAIDTPQVSAGGEHSCAIIGDGTVRCWGSNLDGQRSVPSDLGAVSYLSVRLNSSCAITSAGELRCWGANDQGQRDLPPTLGGVSQVSAGGLHTCAVTTSSELRCWGANSDGQLNIPSTLGSVSQVSAGRNHTCAITSGGTLRCWGANGNGQTNVPSNLGTVTQVTTGDYHTCAITSGGTLRCWGYNGDGQTSVPSNLGSVSQVSAGANHTCALTSGGSLRCWGSNWAGQRTVPTNLGTVRQVSAGENHTCAVPTGGTVRCWGWNNFGQSSVPGDLTNPPASPTPPPGETITPTGTSSPTAQTTQTVITTVTATATRTATATVTATASTTPTTTPTATPTSTGALLQSITPQEGVNDQVTRVTIRGSGFTLNPPPAARLLGGGGSVALTSVTALSSSSFEATVPAGLTPGLYDLLVTSGGNTGILPNAFAVLVAGDAPELSQVVPAALSNDRAGEILVQGNNFAEGAVVRLGGTTLAASRISSQALLAVVPAELSPNQYNLHVTNPNGRQSAQPLTFSVLDGSANLVDDLFSSSDQIWLNPVTPRATVASLLGIFVERSGGAAPLEVEVAFHRDAVNGPELGRATIPLLDPQSTDSTTPLSVQFDTAGEVTIFVIIDPDNRVAERDESNNIVQRTLRIAPTATDQIAPQIDGIGLVGGDEAIVANRELTLEVAASDPDPGSGVQHIHLIEYVYLQETQRWVPMASSGWLPFGDNPGRYAWTLLPQPGMRYLQLRARDATGNISIGSARRLLTYQAPSDRIGRGQTRVYRYQLAANQSLEVNLEVLDGDADLYVWSSRTDQSARVSNLEGSEDERVRIEANQIVPGLYQVEVFGYTSAEYRITTLIGEATGSQPSRAIGGISQAKSIPTTPMVPVSALPDERAGDLPTNPAPSEPTPTSTATAGPSPTPTRTATVGPSATPTSTATAGPSPTPTSTATAGPSPTPTNTVTPPDFSVYLPLIQK